MDTNYGLLNYLLGLVGIPPIQWLDSPSTALISLSIVSIWKSLGYNTLIVLSAMRGVPAYLYEAAELDSSKASTTFFKITFPIISPSLFFLFLINLIASIKVFETVSIMTLGGGPMGSTNTLAYSLYQIGYTSAIGVVLLVIIAICTLLLIGGNHANIYTEKLF